MKLFVIKFSLGIFVFYLKYFIIIANNTIESKNLCEKCFFFFFAKHKYIPYADNVKNDYSIYIYIYYTTIYNLYLYYTLAILYTGKSLVKKMQGKRATCITPHMTAVNIALSVAWGCTHAGTTRSCAYVLDPTTFCAYMKQNMNTIGELLDFW